MQDSRKAPGKKKRMAPAQRKSSFMLDGPGSRDPYGEKRTDRSASNLSPEAQRSFDRIFSPKKKPEEDAQIIPFPKPYRADD